MPATALARDTHRRPARRGRAQEGSAKKRDKTTSDPMSFRLDRDTRSLMDRACLVNGENMSQFIHASIRDRATEVLLNQTYFRLPTAEWNAFVSALDSPPPPNAKLKALLARKAPWED
jgi:uncharacterized protein (DUF1778 family)